MNETCLCRDFRISLSHPYNRSEVYSPARSRVHLDYSFWESRFVDLGDAEE